MIENNYIGYFLKDLSRSARIMLGNYPGEEIQIAEVKQVASTFTFTKFSKDTLYETDPLTTINFKNFDYLVQVIKNLPLAEEVHIFFCNPDDESAPLYNMVRKDGQKLYINKILPKITYSIVSDNVVEEVIIE